MMVELCLEASKATAYIIELDWPNTFYAHKTILKKIKIMLDFVKDLIGVKLIDNIYLKSII